MMETECKQHLCRRRPLWIAAALLTATLSLAGCSKDPAGGIDGGRVPIVAHAALPAGSAAQAATGSRHENTATKAPVDGSQQMTLWFARADMDASGAYGAYGSVFQASRGAGTGLMPLTFAPLQYYPPSGNTSLAGWYPEADTYSDNTLSWTFDGTKDILCTYENKMSVMDNGQGNVVSFYHLLSQLQFFCYADNAETVTYWGKITGIELHDQATVCTRNLAANKTTFSGNKARMAVPGLTEALLPEGDASKAGQFGEAVMVQPQNKTLVLSIHTANRGEQTLAVPVAVEEGFVYRINIRFTIKGISVDPVVTIADWADGGALVNGRTYPYVTDERTIVVQEVLGAADPSAYPTHGPWTSSDIFFHVESESWNTNESGYNTCGRKFRVATRKKGDPYYDGSTINQGKAHWADIFSLCAGYYEDQTGKTDQGLWRVPTARELNLIVTLKEDLVLEQALSSLIWSFTMKAANTEIWCWYEKRGTIDLFATSTEMITLPFLRCVRDM